MSSDQIDLYDEFATLLSPNDKILTFNYDTILEAGIFGGIARTVSGEEGLGGRAMARDVSSSIRLQFGAVARSHCSLLT